MPCWRASRGLWKRVGTPSTNSSPALGAWRPDRIFMSVVLPAPLSPTTPRTSPRMSRSPTSWSAVTTPKRFQMPRASMIGCAAGSLDGCTAVTEASWSTLGASTSGGDLGQCHGTMFTQRAGRRLGDAERLDPVSGGARAGDLAARDPDERLELGPIGVIEADQEVRPQRPGGCGHARLDRPERHPRPESDRHAVLPSEDLRAHVVAERVVACGGEHPHRAA